MAIGTEDLDEMPVVKDLKQFNHASGNLLERMVFNNRVIMIALCAVITIVLAYQASKLAFNADFEKMIPQNQPYVKNYLNNKNELRGLGNSIRVVVENVDGDIFDPQYLNVLQKFNDDLILTPGVDRAWVKSVWMPSVRWVEVTEEGFKGGPVMPDSYDGSQASIQQLKQNIVRAGILGSLVGNNYKSTMITVPLMDLDISTNKRLDYNVFTESLNRLIKAHETPKIKVHVIGFAKLVGDLIQGLKQVMTYFGFAALIAAAIIFAYTRCVRSTLLVIASSITAVIWQLGFVSTIGYELNPYSILVPFLVFAIGVSHGLQKMNGIMQDIGRGTHKYVAARYTFRRLFVAGMTALLADAVGFAVLMLIDIPVIKELALTASVGVAVLIFTNLLLLPVLLSFLGVSAAAAKRSIMVELEEAGGNVVFDVLCKFSSRPWAISAVTVAVLLAVVGFVISLNLKIGDLDPGAPELRPTSRYNRDNDYITKNYSLSSDQFAVIMKTPLEGCTKYESLIEADRLGWELQQLPGVQATASLVNTVRQITAGSYEGSLKWFTLSRNQDVLNFGVEESLHNAPDMTNADTSVMPVIAYLADHKAETLERVVNTAAEFSARHSKKDRQFLLAAGNAGIEAATNIVVREANRTMMLYVYGAVLVLCFITFRNWRAVAVAVLPLMLTSVLCEALMVLLGIGVKVATLPVIALGVGIGVDYALYLLSVQLANQRKGLSLAASYSKAIHFTGKVVGLVGITLAAGVITWVWSPIKFQADMGILLTFMFIWNMVGALVLIPALSYFMLNPAVAVPDSGLAELNGKKEEVSLRRGAVV